MTIDVLAYNSLNVENNTLRTCNTALQTTINSLNSCCSSLLLCQPTHGPSIVNGRMVRPETWNYVETGSGWTAGFKVCDTSGYYRCGASCTWVVPAGVTCARFQIWGAGAQTGSAGCCGFVPFGGSGAYGSVIIPVVAGCTYTLCAGCANCCYSQWNTTGNQNGCHSYVSGHNLTNFCALGGIGNLCQQLIDRGVYYTRSSPIPAWSCYSMLGYCICGTGSSLCSVGNSTPWAYAGCQTCGGGFFTNPHLFLPQYHSSAIVYGSATGGTVYSIAGAYPEMCVNHYCKCGYIKNVPIYGFEGSSQCTFGLQTSCSCGGNYCSTSATFGAVTASLLIPGSGGFAMQVAGGCLSICGDAGRMGMVCVCYK